MNYSHSHSDSDYSYSHSDTQTTSILTQTHRLPPLSLRLTDYSHSHSDKQTTPILRHTDYSILLRKSNVYGSIKEPVHSNAVQALAGGTIWTHKPPPGGRC